MGKINFKRHALISCSLLVVFTVLFTFIAAFLSYFDTDDDKNYQIFSSGWVNENGDPVSLDSLSESCVIHKELPIYNNDTILSFNARNLDVEVYIGDQRVYRTEKTKDAILNAIYGKTSGSDFVEIPILKEYGGKIVYIHAVTPYSNGRACKIVHMYLGNGVEIVKHDTSIQLGAFSFSVIILFLGIACIVLYLPMKKNEITDNTMLFLGIAAFTFGMSMITDCKLLHIIFGHESLFYVVSQMFMLLIPVPLLMFFSQLYGNLNEKLVFIFCVANVLDCVTMFILNCMGIMDYYENSPMVLLIVAGTIIYLGIATVKDIILHGNRNLLHNLGVLMIAIAVVLDMVMTHSDTFVETSFFTRFGIAGFTFMECMQVLSKHIENYKSAMRAQLVSRLAYHDGLTDLLNRTSFKEDVDKLEKEPPESILIGVFDVNNLKFVNDNFGHSDGDELIIRVAKSLKLNFEKFGRCYRTGGDEFIFISTEKDSEERFNTACTKMQRELHGISRDSKYPVSVASGYSIRKSPDQELIKVLNEADDKMYENKKKMKTKLSMPMGPRPLPKK